MARRATKIPDLTIATTGEATKPRDDVRVAPVQTGGAGGSPPDDPMLEKRVEALETQGKRIEDALHRIEVRLAESVKQSEFTNLSREVGELKGLISGLEKRFSAIPTTWQIIAILATLMIGLFGLSYTANNAANLFQKTPITLPQPSTQPSPAK